jgi:DNA invertase Pin-like site-specific DNA recombinase
VSSTFSSSGRRAASEAQIKTVRELRRRAVSLRGIAEETSLGLQTVRSILDQQDGVRPHQHQAPATHRLRSLPRRIAAVEKANAELRTEAKGLK